MSRTDVYIKLIKTLISSNDDIKSKTQCIDMLIEFLIIIGSSECQEFLELGRYLALILDQINQNHAYNISSQPFPLTLPLLASSSTSQELLIDSYPRLTLLVNSWNEVLYKLLAKTLNIHTNELFLPTSTFLPIVFSIFQSISNTNYVYNYDLINIINIFTIAHNDFNITDCCLICHILFETLSKLWLPTPSPQPIPHLSTPLSTPVYDIYTKAFEVYINKIIPDTCYQYVLQAMYNTMINTILPNSLYTSNTYTTTSAKHHANLSEFPRNETIATSATLLSMLKITSILHHAIRIPTTDRTNPTHTTNTIDIQYYTLLLDSSLDSSTSHTNICTILEDLSCITKVSAAIQYWQWLQLLIADLKSSSRYTSLTSANPPLFNTTAAHTSTSTSAATTTSNIGNKRKLDNDNTSNDNTTNTNNISVTSNKHQNTNKDTSSTSISNVSRQSNGKLAFEVKQQSTTTITNMHMNINTQQSSKYTQHHQQQQSAAPRPTSTVSSTAALLPSQGI